MDNMTLAQLQQFAAKHKSADDRLNAGEAQMTDVVSRLVAPTIERLQTNEAGMQDIVNRTAGPALIRTNAAAKRMGKTVLKLAQNPHSRSMENASEMTGVLARLQTQGFPSSSGEQPIPTQYPLDSQLVQGQPSPGRGTSFTLAGAEGMGVPRAAQGPPPRRGGHGVGAASNSGVPDIAPFQYGLPPRHLPPRQSAALPQGPAPPAQPLPSQPGQSGATGFGAITGLPTGPAPLNPGSQYDIYCTNGQAGAVLEGSGPPTPGSTLMAKGVLGAGVTAAYLAFVTAQCADLSQQPPPTNGQSQCPPGQAIGVMDYTDAGQPIYGCLDQLIVQQSPPATPPAPAPEPIAPPAPDGCDPCIQWAVEAICRCLRRTETPVDIDEPAAFMFGEGRDRWHPRAIQWYGGWLTDWLGAGSVAESQAQREGQTAPGGLGYFGAEAGGAVGGDTTAFSAPDMGD